MSATNVRIIVRSVQMLTTVKNVMMDFILKWTSVQIVRSDVPVVLTLAIVMCARSLTTGDLGVSMIVVTAVQCVTEQMGALISVTHHITKSTLNGDMVMNVINVRTNAHLV